MLRILLLGVVFPAILACPGWAQGGCPAPSGPVSRVDSGSIKLDWLHPCALSDTCRAGEGPAQGSVFVEPNANQGRIAILLPAAAGERVITEIAAYYRGATGTSEEDWANSGPLSWSVWADSDGVPSHPAEPELVVAFGVDPDLRIGGTRTDTCSLSVPNGPAWLVATWPDGPEIVQIGTNAPRSGVLILMGYSSDGAPQWVGWAGHGLAVSAVAVAPDSLDCPEAGPSQPANTVVIRERLGVGTKAVDTVILPWDATGYQDYCLCPGERRVYSVGYTCGTQVGECMSFDTIAVPRACSSRVAPLAVAAVLALGDELPSLVVHNPSPDSLLVSAGFPAILAPASPGVDTLCRVWGYPAQATLAPYDSLSVALQFSEGRPSTGEFCGSVALSVGVLGQGEDHYCIPIQVTFDPPVWVPLEPIDEGGSESALAPLSAWANRSMDGRVSIQITLDTRENAWWGAAAPVGTEGTLQVHIVNILGQRMAAANSTFSGTRFVDQDRMATVIEIDGSETWPSGVYPCRVSVGAKSVSFPIVIAR